MTIELSRRWFIFGSAAAVAAAAIKQSFATLVPTPAPPYISRQISDYILYPYHVPGTDEFATFNIYIRDNLTRSASINTRGFYHWSSSDPLDMPMIMQDDVFRIEMIGGSGLGEVVLTCRDKIDDGPRVHLLERWTFPIKGPAEFNYLHYDNSLEARLERERAPLDFLRDVSEEDADLWET